MGVHSACTNPPFPRQVRRQAAALRRRLHRHGLQRAHSPATGLRVRAGNEEEGGAAVALKKVPSVELECSGAVKKTGLALEAQSSAPPSLNTAPRGRVESDNH